MAWWITAGVFAFLFLLLCLPVTVLFGYQSYEEQALNIRVRWLFFGRQLVPEPPPKHPEKKAKKEAKKAKKPKKIKKAKGKSQKISLASWEDFRDLWESFSPLLIDCRRALSFLGRHSRLTHGKVLASIGGPNAAEAGKNCGRFCSFFYPFLGVLRQFIPIKNPYLHIVPNYLGAGDVYEVAFRLRLAPLIVLIGGLRLLWQLLCRLLTYNKKQKQMRQQMQKISKGGTVNEPEQSPT